MELGEVTLLTSDVPRLASFYKDVLGIHSGTEDANSQVLLLQDIRFTVRRDAPRENSQSIILAFHADTVEDMDQAYRRAYALGAVILQPPTVDPLGVVSIRFLDPDDNLIHIRCIPQYRGER